MSAMIYPGNLFFGEKNDAIYDLMQFMPPGLCLDIGAAAGKITRKLAKIPGSRVTCYEPFEGNFPHFERNTDGFSNVRLIKKAVSDFDGAGRLFVGSTLQGTERGWEGYAGYSSSGMLISKSDRRWEDARTGDVPVCSIDATVDENVRLMKIDVQGGETGVLRGAEKTMDRHGVDLIYVEFEGDANVIHFLMEKGYTIFDSGIYVYDPKEGSPPADSLSSEFRIARLSSGREIYKGPLTKRPLDANDYVDFVQNLGEWALQTDLVAVHHSILPAFLEAAGQRLRTEYRQSQGAA